MRNEQRKASHREHDANEHVRNHDPHVLERATQQAMRRARQAHEVPEPTLGARLGQIGILGWMVVIPTLLGVWLGHWLDRHFGTGVFFSAPLLMVGAAIGLWLAWRWMHRQGTKD